MTAACGSSGASRAPRISTYALRFSRCMRANGVPNFPDPGPNTQAVLLRSGINPASPAYESADNTCKRYLPSSKPPPPIPPSVRRELLAWARCMRANGVPGVPDPDADGIQFPAGDPLVQSPAFERADNGPCKRYEGAPGH